MRSAVGATVALAYLLSPVAAQTFSNCNPTVQSGCPPDSALGRTVNIDFSSPSDSFTPQGNPTYGPDGVSFTVAKSGDSPQLTSKWYLMFGRVDVVLKAAPGAGIVSSFVMQSDDLDEIDWEWLGATPDEVQSNYFGKGQTTTYDRGAFHADPGSQSGFKTYSVEWTANQIVWQINGQTVRTLEPANAKGQYPQTPMQIKVGAWSGGDPANAPGTIQWARGPTDYSKGPFTMQVKSLKVSDYSTGTQYIYGDQSGSWQSIKSNGGKVNPGAGVVDPNPPPAITSKASGQPIPFTPTETPYTKPSVFPWVPQSSSVQSVSRTLANYPGLPSGWTVTDSGKVVPPSSAPSTPPPASSTPSSSAPSPSASSSGASNSAQVSSSKTTTSAQSSAQSGFTTLTTKAPSGTTTGGGASGTPSRSGSAPATTSTPAAPPSAASQLLVHNALLPLAAFLGVLLVL